MSSHISSPSAGSLAGCCKPPCLAGVLKVCQCPADSHGQPCCDHSPRCTICHDVPRCVAPALPLSRSDDALWALDGLASGSAATARDSLATLAEICASKRGRLALRSGQLAADVLAAAGRCGSSFLCCAALWSYRVGLNAASSHASTHGQVAPALAASDLLPAGGQVPPLAHAGIPSGQVQMLCGPADRRATLLLGGPDEAPPLPLPLFAGALKVSSDPVQALGLATLLLCFCQADADPALLGRREVAEAAAQLLQVWVGGWVWGGDDWSLFGWWRWWWW